MLAGPPQSFCIYQQARVDLPSACDIMSIRYRYRTSCCEPAVDIFLLVTCDDSSWRPPERNGGDGVWTEPARAAHGAAGAGASLGGGPGRSAQPAYGGSHAIIGRRQWRRSSGLLLPGGHMQRHPAHFAPGGSALRTVQFLYTINIFVQIFLKLTTVSSMLCVKF